MVNLIINEMQWPVRELRWPQIPEIDLTRRQLRRCQVARFTRLSVHMMPGIIHCSKSDQGIQIQVDESERESEIHAQ